MLDILMRGDNDLWKKVKGKEENLRNE